MTTTIESLTAGRTHRPWCTGHEYGIGQGEIVDWGFCSSGTVDVGGVLVDVNDGALNGDAEVSIGTDGLTIDQARELASLLLSLCAALESEATS